MSEKFNPIIQGLLSESPLANLKFIEKHDPSLFKEQVQTIVNKKSLFLHLFDERSYDKQYGLDLYHLFERNGYDVTKVVSDLSESVDAALSESNKNIYLTEEYMALEKRRKMLKPDILKILIRENEELSIHLIEKLGKDYFLQLEKENYPVLPMLYNAKNTPLKVIKLISEFGLDYNKTYEGYKDYESLAENKPELLNYYISLPNDNKEQKIEVAFQKSKDFIQRKVGSMSTTKEEFKTPEIVHYLSLRLPFMEQSKQEELIGELYSATDLRVLNGSLKIVGKNFKTYKPTYEPIWRNISLINNHNLFLNLLEKNIALDSYDKKRDTYYIKEILKSITHLDVNFYKDPYDKGNKPARDNNIVGKLRECFSSDILISNVEGKNHTWFTELCKEVEYLSKSRRNETLMPLSVMYKICSISPVSTVFDPSYESKLTINGKIGSPVNKITKEEWENNFKEGEENYTKQQRLVIRELLDKTLFNRDESGDWAVDIMLKNQSHYLKSTFINVKKLWEQDLIEPIFTKEEKLCIYHHYMQKHLVELINTSGDNLLLTYIIDNFKKDKSISHNDVKLENPLLDAKGYAKAKEIYTDLHDQKLFEYLEDKIPSKTTSTTKKKL